MPHLRPPIALAAVLTAVVCATAADARAAAKADPVVSLSRHLASLAVKLRAARTKEERAELREQIEWTKHRLGPTDAAGRRIACEAMWHDAALRDLEQAIGRAGGTKAATAAAGAKAGRFRLPLQQMAAVGLARGWVDADGVDRYRFDFVGTSIATHLPDLEGLLGRAAKHLTAAGMPVLPPPTAEGPAAAEGTGGATTDTSVEPAAEAAGQSPTSEASDRDAPADNGASGGPAPEGYWSSDAAGKTKAGAGGGPFEPDAEASGQPRAAEASASGAGADARSQALALVQDGLGRLVAAAGRAHAADRTTEAGRTVQQAALVAFIDALADVHRAASALDAAGPAGPVVLPPEEQPGLTEAHRAALAKAEALLAGIEAPAWQAIRDDLSALLATAGQGLKVPRARRQARRLLEVVTRTAEYIRDLLASRMALPEHVTDRQEQITEALEYLKRPEYREGQYRRLLRIAGGDSLRRILDASDLTPEAGRGLLRLLRTPRSAFTGKNASNRHYYFIEDVQATIRAIGRAGRDPPAGLDPHCASLHAQTAAALVEAAADLGVSPPADPALLRQRAAETAAYAEDLDRLERAGRVIHAARSLMGERAKAFAEAVLKRTEPFVLAPSKEHRDDRRAFDLYLSSVDGLARLRLPDKAHTAVAMRLSGGAYRSAAARFAENLDRNFASAAQGNPQYLESTLAAAPMFTLLRHRAIAETTGLADVDPAGLDPFAIPPKPWQACVAAMDRRMAGLMKAYGSIRGWSRGGSVRLDTWDDVYSTVLAAQHRTREAAEGEPASPVDRLVRALQGATEPRIDAETWVGWATGYHTLEAAVCLMASYPVTAGEHLRRLRSLRHRHYVPHRLTWRVFDPLE